MTEVTKKQFMTEQVMELLKNLQSDTEPNFGLMTPQHMIEHLTWTLKSATKRKGTPSGAPTKSQLGFQRFISKGAIFEHRPSDKTKADLPELKYGSLEEAIEQIPVAINRFYNHFEANPDFKSYSDFIGELDFEQLELFHSQHYKFHFWQFGLLKEYA